MGFGVAFFFTIAFVAALSLVFAGDPSILRIVGESKSRAIYGHCYLTATDADLLACIDISSGSLSWRFPIDERQVRNGKKVVAGDKVAYVLSFSTENSGATVYSINIKDGTLLWSLPLSSGEFLGEAVDMSYSRSENALYVLLHNAFHKITTVGTEPSATTMTLNDDILPGLRLLHLIDNVAEKSSVKRGVAVGCIRGSDSMCRESAVLQLNTETGDSVEVTKIKSSFSGSTLFASDNHVFRVDMNTEGTSKLSVKLEQTSYTGSQQQVSTDISLTSLVGSGDKIGIVDPQFYRLNQTPIIHLKLQVLRFNASPQTLHFILSTSADGKLINLFSPHSAEDKVIVSLDHVASSSHSIRQLHVFTSESNAARSELDGKIRIVSCKRELFGNDNMVGLWKESEKTIVAEGGSRISAFRLTSASLSSVTNLWTRQEALAQIQQAILLPGLTMKTSSSFFGALDSICATSQLPWVKPLCGVFDQTKTLLDSVEVAFQRILPSRVPHHRHGHKGTNTLTEGQDHVIAISFNGDASSLAQNPQPLNALNLQVHSLVFPHDLAILKALHGSVEKSVLMSSRRLAVSHGGRLNDVLVRSVRLLLVPQSADDEDGTVSVRVIADIVDGGVISWVTSFSLEEDMRVRNGDDYLPVLSSSNAQLMVKTLLPSEEWEIVGDLAAVMPTHLVSENTTTETVAVVPLPGKEHHHLQNVKTPNFVHTVSHSHGEISIYETRSRRKVANVKFDPSMEEIVDVTFPVAEDLIYSRVSILGDDNILVKYLNPNMIVVCTATTSSSTANDNDTSNTLGSQVFVNLVDVVSGKVLQRVVVDSAAAPVRAHLMENFVLISYWNPVLKRAEILTMGLFDGVIGKTDYLPFASKPNVGTREHDEKTTVKNAAQSVDSVHLSAEDEEKAILLRSSFLTSIPLVMQRTYLMPHKVMDIGHTLSRHGLTNKNILLTLESGEVYSLDFRILHPRRPMSDPTASEKEEGLMRYGPIFPLMPQMTLTMEQRLRPTGRYPTHTLSAPSYLESEALVFIYGRFNDVLFTSVTPSQGFDTLAANFNYTALVGLITLLFVAVMVLRRMHRTTTLKRMWQ